MAKTQQERGESKKVYFDAEADDMLDQIAVATSVARSNVVCALVRIAAGGKPRPGEEAISAMLKRAVGRESMIQFLTAVAEVVGPDAKAVPHTKPNGAPEAWIYSGGLGVLAFFQPNEANVGDIFTKASRLMADFALSRVIVATTNGHTLDGTFRQRLAGAGIDLVALADLRSAIHEATGAATSAGGKSGAGTVVDQVLRAAAAKKPASRPARSGSR